MIKNQSATAGKTQRYLRLQTRLSICFSALAISASALLTFALYLTVRGQLRQDFRERLCDVVSIAALQVNGDEHATLTDANQEGNAVYMRIKHVLQQIRDKATDIRYVYTWRVNPEGRLVFVVDAETNPENISHIGDVYENNEPAFLAPFANLNRAITDKEPTADKWGTWLSGYAPFYRSDGQREGILGMDISTAKVTAHERQFLWVAFAVFAATIPLAMAMGWLLGRKLAAPIVKLAIASELITKGNFDHRVSLNSKDEIGRLAVSFNEMTQSLQQTIAARDKEIAERKKAENEIQWQSYVQTIINKLLGLSLENLKLEEILGQALNLIVDIPWLSLELKGCIFMVEQDADVLVMKAFHGLAEPLKEICARVPFGRCLCGRAALTGQIQFADCINEHHENRYDGMLPHGHYCVPVVSDGKVIGVINLYTKEGHRRSEKEESFLLAAADVIASIIKRKQAEEMLEGLNKELETTIQQVSSANRELQGFAYIIAHDLKAPVRAIGTLAHWIATDYEQKLDQNGKENLVMLINRVNRMYDFLDGILEYSKLMFAEEGRQKVDLNELIHETIQTLRPPENIEINVENRLPTIIAGKNSMMQVFRNLLSNAIRYMDKPTGQINIGCVEENGFLKFSVADNGSGIDEKYFKKIFKIFQTLSPRDKFESTGIGLSIVKKTVEMHGGSVWVESEVGKGSTFFFTLPRSLNLVENDDSTIESGVKYE